MTGGRTAQTEARQGRPLGHWLLFAAGWLALLTAADPALAQPAPAPTQPSALGGLIALAGGETGTAFSLSLQVLLLMTLLTLLPSVLRHRLVLSFAAEAEQTSPDDVIAAVLAATPFPR